MQAIAAVPGHNTPRFVDWPDPGPPGAGEVRCRTIELGVCGTDREILLSERPLVPTGAAHLVLGHECLGRIEALGPNTPRWQVGDWVVPFVRRARGAAKHRVDMLAFGEYTERGIVEEHGFSAPVWLDRTEHLVAVPPAVVPFAVLTEPLAVAEKAVNEALAVQRGRFGPSAWREPPRVLVTGLGPIGFAAVIAARCRDWPVTLAGRDAPDTSRACLARELGADYVNTDRLTTPPTQVERDGFDLLLECTGSDDVLLAATEHLAARGAAAWLGSSRRPEPAVHNVAQLMRTSLLRNHVHIGCVNAAPRDFADALEHLGQLGRSHPAALARLITRRVPPAAALPHYVQREPQGIKVVVQYE